MHLKLSSAKWWPFCLGLNVLTNGSAAYKWNHTAIDRDCLATTWVRNINTGPLSCAGNNRQFPETNGQKCRMRFLQWWKKGKWFNPTLYWACDFPSMLGLNRTMLFKNKANLRDLIAATGLVILLKFDPNHRFFVPCDLEIWWMTLENNRAPLLYYIKLCLSFQIHWWIETEVTVRKRSIRVKIGDFLSCVTLKLDGWPWKTIGHLFYTTLSFVHHFKSIGEFKLELQSGNAQFGSISAIFLSRVTL